jgi:hypothetical protein
MMFDALKAKLGWYLLITAARLNPAAPAARGIRHL